MARILTLFWYRVRPTTRLSRVCRGCGESRDELAGEHPVTTCLHRVPVRTGTEGDTPARLAGTKTTPRQAEGHLNRYRQGPNHGKHERETATRRRRDDAEKESWWARREGDPVGGGRGERQGDRPRVLFPNGRDIFYEGDSPRDFRTEIIEEYGFDPAKTRHGA